jgi:hypothetical protein
MVMKIAIFTILLSSACPSIASAVYRLPDTGQTTCYSTDTYAVIPCKGTGQDGEYGINAMSFTDIDVGTVTDNNTGLMWQKENGTNTYNWYEASGFFDATNNPDSRNVCSALSLGGYTDWRLPSKKELVSLVDYSVSAPGPMIKDTFINTSASSFWSSTENAGNPAGAWAVDFNYGNVASYNKTTDYAVRCVRGAEKDTSLIDNHNGTVTDTRTGLMWQQVTPGPMNLSASLSYCESSTLGDYSDWRLPNIKELESWFDDTRNSPAINTAYFQTASSGAFWSSSTRAGMTASAWGIEASNGELSYYNKLSTINHNVQCVRGGALGNLNLGFSDTGSGTVTGNGLRYAAPVSFSTNTALAGNFDSNTTVNLHASPAEYYLFSGWSGACSGTGDCSILMDSDKNVTASFTKDITHSALIGGTTTYYSTLQTAYNEAPAGSTIRAWGTDFTENLNANINKAVTLEGGYNSDHTSNSGHTTLHGILTIENGSLTAENFEIQ